MNTGDLFSPRNLLRPDDLVRFMFGRRFLITVAVTALPPLSYAVTVLSLAGPGDGLQWLKNDPAFSVFALFILPVLFGLLVNCADWNGVRKWEDRRSLYVLFGVLTACGLVVVAADVPKQKPESGKPGALTAPLLLREHAAALKLERTLRSNLPQPRDILISKDDDAQKKAAADAEQKYETARRDYFGTFPGWTSFGEYFGNASLLAWLGIATNIVAALFCAWTLCYLFILVRIRRIYEASNVDSLIIVLSFALLWFPCRVYSDWYANFYTVRNTLVSYSAFWLAAALGLVAILLLVVVLSPQKPLSKVVGTISAILGAVTGTVLAVKPSIAFYAAEAFERAGTPFVVVFAIVAVGALLVLIDATRDAGTLPVHPDPT